MVCGAIDLRPGTDEVFWAVEAAPAKAARRDCRSPSRQRPFSDGVAYLETIERVQVETPDARLDAAVAAVCHAIDAHCDTEPVHLPARLHGYVVRITFSAGGSSVAPRPLAGTIG